MTSSETPFEASPQAQAAAWVARLHAEDATEADWLALESWLAADPSHGRVYAEAEGLWAAVETHRAAILSELEPTDAADGHDDGLTELARRRHRGRWRRRALAAAPLAAALVAGLLLVGPLIENRAVTYVTAPGQTREVVLKDGTTIAMNGGSRLTVRMTRDARTVEMGQAEAAFDVTHDPSRPFLIAVGESQVRVIGTAFNIRRDDASTRVSVSRGIVQVSDIANPTLAVRLTVGESVTRQDATDRTVIRREGADEAQAWRAGRLIYRDRPLSEVATDLSRAFPVPVTVATDASTLRFTGVLELGDQDQVITRIEAFLPVTAYRAEGRIELRRRQD
jgi:transmembrane sensor